MQISINMPSCMEQSATYFTDIEEELKKIFANSEEKYIYGLSCTFQHGKATISFYTKKDGSKFYREKGFKYLVKKSNYSEIYSALMFFPEETKCQLSSYTSILKTNGEYEPIHVDQLCIYLKTCSKFLNNVPKKEDNDAQKNVKETKDVKERIQETKDIYKQFFSLEVESSNERQKQDVVKRGTNASTIMLEDGQPFISEDTSEDEPLLAREDKPLLAREDKSKDEPLLAREDKPLLAREDKSKDGHQLSKRKLLGTSHTRQKSNRERVSSCTPSTSRLIAKWWNNFSNAEKFVIVVVTILVFILGFVFLLIPPTILTLILVLHYENFHDNHTTPQKSILR